jgi:hypothetical protein
MAEPHRLPNAVLGVSITPRDETTHRLLPAFILLPSILGTLTLPTLCTLIEQAV